ncbi:unnamed protein product, partial [Prorocentrum cordatum]
GGGGAAPARPGASTGAAAGPAAAASMERPVGTGSHGHAVSKHARAIPTWARHGWDENEEERCVFFLGGVLLVILGGGVAMFSLRKPDKADKQNVDSRSASILEDGSQVGRAMRVPVNPLPHGVRRPRKEVVVLARHGPVQRVVAVHLDLLLMPAGRTELTQADAEDRATMAPEDMLPSAINRQATRETERAKLQAEVDGLTEQLEVANPKPSNIKQQLVESNAEVAQAKLVNTPQPFGGATDMNGYWWRTCQQFLIEGAGGTKIVTVQKLCTDGETKLARGLRDTDGSQSVTRAGGWSPGRARAGSFTRGRPGTPMHVRSGPPIAQLRVDTPPSRTRAADGAGTGLARRATQLFERAWSLTSRAGWTQIFPPPHGGLRLRGDSHAEALKREAAFKRAKSIRELALGRARSEVDRLGIRSAAPQAVTDNQMNFWSDIWQGDAESAHGKCEDLSSLEQVAKQVAGELRRHGFAAANQLSALECTATLEPHYSRAKMVFEKQVLMDISGQVLEHGQLPRCIKTACVGLVEAHIDKIGNDFADTAAKKGTALHGRRNAHADFDRRAPDRVATVGRKSRRASQQRSAADAQQRGQRAAEGE